MSFTNDSANISEFHCCIFKVKDNFFLKAFDGMKVNDKLVDGEVKLQHLDKVEFVTQTGQHQGVVPPVYHVLLPVDPDKKSMLPPSASILNSRVYSPLIRQDISSKINKLFIDLIAPFDSNPKETKFHAWNKVEVNAIKKYLLMYGYGRWSKIRAASKHAHSCKILMKKADDDMRPYANMFLIHLVNCLTEDPNFHHYEQIVLEFIQILPNDHKYATILSPHDFGENIESRAKFWL